MTDTKAKLNARKLVGIAEWVGAQESRRQLGLVSEWDQSHWLRFQDELLPVRSCGTAACIAGRVCLDAGWLPEAMADGMWGTDYDEESRVVRVVDPKATPLVVLEERNVGELAADLLGLDYDQADRLFNGDNSYEQVVAIIGDLLSEANLSEAELAKL